MTDYSLADEITAIWNDVRPIFAGAFHADAYSLIRTTRVSDGSGGYTDVEAVVESGRCALNVTLGNQGNESLSGDVIEGTYRLAAELPKDTIALDTDVIEINATRYQIVSVKRGGNHTLFPVADLEERT